MKNNYSQKHTKVNPVDSFSASTHLTFSKFLKQQIDLGEIYFRSQAKALLFLNQLINNVEPWQMESHSICSPGSFLKTPTHYTVPEWLLNLLISTKIKGFPKNFDIFEESFNSKINLMSNLFSGQESFQIIITELMRTLVIYKVY